MNALYYEGNLEDYYPGHVLGEIYKDKIYDPYLKGKTDLVIMDVGGNLGWATNYFAQFAKKIYTVEPSAEHCQMIKALIKQNGLKDKVTLIQAAVSNQPGKLKLNHNQNKTMFSLSSVVADKSLPTEEVEVKTLEQIMEEQKIDHVDFLKLDPEGEEANILCSDSFRRIADKIDLIIYEYHTFSQRVPIQINNTLRDLGFFVAQLPTEATVFAASRIKP